MKEKMKKKKKAKGNYQGCRTMGDEHRDGGPARQARACTNVQAEKKDRASLNGSRPKRKGDAKQKTDLCDGVRKDGIQFRVFTRNFSGGRVHKGNRDEEGNIKRKENTEQMSA